MDTVTHLLLGYLLGQGVFDDPVLVLLVTIMGVLPDLDTVTWAAPNRFGTLRHRGQTHSILLGFVASLGAATLAWALAGVAWPLAFLAAFLGFASHVVLDVVNWGCWVYWPWRSDRIQYTVQYGLKGPFLTSTAAGAVLLFAHTASPRAAGWLEMALSMVWLGYLGGKVAVKAYLHRVHGAGATITPTHHPLVWHVASRAAPGGVLHRVLHVRDAAGAPTVAGVADAAAAPVAVTTDR